jgi:hypothetical protein
MGLIFESVMMSSPVLEGVKTLLVGEVYGNALPGASS